MEPSPVALRNVPSPNDGTRVLSPSGMEDASSLTWLQLHGSEDWDGLLRPLHPSLLAEVLIKCGRFAQATYDAYDFKSFSKYRGTCRYCYTKLLDEVGLADSGYEVTKHLYATMTELPVLLRCLLKLVPADWLQRLLQMDSWSEDSNWMGFVAVSGDQESRRLGRRDILVAWRGTMEPSELFKETEWRLEPLKSTDGGSGSAAAMVEHGFQSIYTSKSRCKKYTKSSAAEQVMEEIRRLVEKYRREDREVSLTVTGHSLGGALALLSALDAAAASIPGLSHVSVISFGAPQVGNAAFGAELVEKGVSVLRVVIREDGVPRLPGLLDWDYQHAGVEVELDLLDGQACMCLNVVSAHSMKTYLHLVSQSRPPLSVPSEPAAGAHAPLLQQVYA